MVMHNPHPVSDIDEGLPGMKLSNTFLGFLQGKCKQSREGYLTNLWIVQITYFCLFYLFDLNEGKKICQLYFPCSHAKPHSGVEYIYCSFSVILFVDHD
jgi:hypothetical protein